MKVVPIALMAAVFCCYAGSIAFGQESQEVPLQHHDRLSDLRVPDDHYSREYQDDRASFSEKDVRDEAQYSSTKDFESRRDLISESYRADRVQRKYRLTEKRWFGSEFEVEWHIARGTFCEQGFVRSARSGPPEDYFSIDYHCFAPILK